MNYNDQLKTSEWKNKREEILQRDHYKCTECNLDRSKLLGLSIDFGVNKLESLKDKGYFIKKKNNDLLLYKDKKNIATCENIDVEEFNINFSKSLFAKQWIESKNKFEFGRFRYVCFNEKNLTNTFYDKRSS